MGHMSLIVNDWQDVRTPLPLLFLSRSAFCLKAGYDPDTDPYDVRFAVIELTPEEPPDSWLKDVFIQVQGRAGAGQGQCHRAASQEMMLKRQIAALQIRIGRGRAAIKTLDLPQWIRSCIRISEPWTFTKRLIV